MKDVNPTSRYFTSMMKAQPNFRTFPVDNSIFPTASPPIIPWLSHSSFWKRQKCRWCDHEYSKDRLWTPGQTVWKHPPGGVGLHSKGTPPASDLFVGNLEPRPKDEWLACARKLIT